MKPADFRTWRDGLGLTQEEAAQALGIPYATYRAFERGYRECHQPVLYGLAMQAVIRKLKPWPSSTASSRGR